MNRTSATTVLSAFLALGLLISGWGASGMVTTGVQAETLDLLTIAQARSQPLGSTVTVQGTTTVAAGSYNAGFAIQDGTAGIYVYPSALVDVELGETVLLTGTLATYNCLLEVTPSPSNVQTAGTAPVPDPKPYTTGAIGEATEGWLVVITGTVAGRPSNPFTVNDGSGAVQVYVDADTGINLSGVQNGVCLRVVGFSGQHDTSAPCDTGWQVMPRQQSDLAPCSGGELAIAKSAPASLDVSQLFTYTLVAANHIGGVATGVVITDALPLSVTIATISDGGAHLGGNVVSWTVTSLAHGGNVTRTVAVTAPSAATTLVNSDYGVWAGNWPTRTVGAPVVSLVGCNTIYGIQYTADPGLGGGTYPSPCVGEFVTVDGIVYATFSGRGFFMADAPGPWHGIYVYYPSGALPAIGDEVRVTGTVQEYYGLTELGDYASYTVLSSGNVPYGPSVVTAAQIPYDTAAASEGYESVFVETHDITVTAGNDSHSIWTFTDVSAGTGKADDWGYNANPAVDDTYAILRGPLVYDWDEYKIMPRDANDVVGEPPTGLLLAKSAPSNVAPGDEMTYLLTVQNYTGQALNTLTVTDAVPAHATFARALDGGVQGGGVVSWTVGSLADQGSLSLRFVVTATGGAGSIIHNDDYAAWAANWVTPTLGAPVVTVIGGYTPIHVIQGNGSRSPLVGQTVKTRGVVVGFFQGNSSYVGDFNGFYIQDPAGDGDPATSDGIFVKHATSLNPGVSAGDVVTVTGVVDEFSEYDGPSCGGDACQTQIYISSAGAVQVSGTAGLPPATWASPPGDEVLGWAYWESLEGMRVTLPHTSTVVAPTSYGTIMAVSGTLGIDHVLRAGPYAGMPVGVRHWKKYGDLDDNSDPPNLIVGSVVDNVGGPLGFSYGSYIVVTQAGDAWNAVYNRPAPDPPPSWPPAATDEFTVLSFNAHNFFDSVNDPGVEDPVVSPADYATHRAKIVRTIVQAGCPVIVNLQEVEKLAVLQDVAGLLATQGCTCTAVLSEGLDGRGIDVGYLVRDDRVTVEGVSQYQDCTTYDTGLGQGNCPAGQQMLFSRVPLVMTATVQIGPSPDDTVQVIVIGNHLKSKLSRSGDPESAQWRLLQAQSLARLVDQIRTDDPLACVIVLGDLNDFEDSSPLAALTASGHLSNTWYTLPAEERYSYIYGGKAQVLDHILVSPALAYWLHAMSPLHYNADFPYHPYTDDETVIWRASDHDPVIVTFQRQDHVLYLPLVMRSATP